jgi:hypothetical protein
MQGTIAEKLNIIPEKKIISFQAWFKLYNTNILHMYSIFQTHLANVEPFHAPNFFNNQNLFRTFAIMLYKSTYAIL